MAANKSEAALDAHGAPTDAEALSTLDPSKESRRWLRGSLRFDGVWERCEFWLLVVLLLGCVVLASLGFFLRQIGAPSSPWLDVLPRYFTLGVAFMGASVATRRGSHIAIDILCRFLPESMARRLRLISSVVSAVVSVFLMLAAWLLMESERESGSAILDVLPTWIPVTVMILGFGTMAFRFLLQAGRQSLWGWAVALVLVVIGLVAGAVDWFPGWVPDASDSLLADVEKISDYAFASLKWLGPLIIGLGLIAGAPLFIVLGGSALCLFYVEENPIAVVPVEIYRLVEAPTLVTLPLFTLMGGVLAQGGAPARLVRLVRAWLGWLPGGLAFASVVICAFFTTFSGASGVTILALGLLLNKLLIEEGYSEELSLGLITSSGSIGLLFAPALPLIIYGIVAKVDIDHMFLAGIGPGALLIAVVAGIGVFLSRKNKLVARPFVRAEAMAAARGAMWEVLLPVMILGLLLSGMATVTEAAAVGALYALVIAGFVHKDVDLIRAMPKVISDSGVLIGAVLIILGLALGFTGFLVDAEVPQHVVDWAQANLGSKWTFLLATNLLLLVVGCLLDIFSAIIVFVPLLMPVALAFDVNPVHLGIIFLANLEIGYLTPPVGMNLFLSSFRFEKDLPQIWRTVLPFLVGLLVALLLITYVPAMTLWLVPGG